MAEKLANTPYGFSEQETAVSAQEAVPGSVTAEADQKVPDKTGQKQVAVSKSGSNKKRSFEEILAARKAQMKEITERLEAGLKEYMASDEQFKKVLEITISVLEEQLKDCLSRVYSKAVLLERWSSPEFFENGILEIPSQTFKWPIPCIEINDSITDESKKINFVIFKHPCGDWAAQCVALNKKDLFGKRISFPESWAGLDADRLPKISGVETATFCHLGCFFVRAKTKEDVIRMCKIAMG
jgi:uncharacterized UPF0160 family protein